MNASEVHEFFLGLGYTPYKQDLRNSMYRTRVLYSKQLETSIPCAKNGKTSVHAVYADLVVDGNLCQFLEFDITGEVANTTESWFKLQCYSLDVGDLTPELEAFVCAKLLAAWEVVSA